MNTLPKPTKVILAGAGPGDPELITLKLRNQLSRAEVILVDRLVNPAIIDLYADPSALVLMTGKQGYHDGSVAQEDINKLMVHHALNGKQVLRLKGGDVSIYSNILDELNHLHEHGISYEIIPGITAASGASAYTGIPLTAKGYSKSVQFITYNPCSYYSPEKWRSLATSHDTLVFYMASKNLGALTEILLRYTRNPQTPLAIVEQATTVHQKVSITTIQNYARDFGDAEYSSPSLVIIGDVVSLYEKFRWFNEDTLQPGSVFPELVVQQILV